MSRVRAIAIISLAIISQSCSSSEPAGLTGDRKELNAIFPKGKQGPAENFTGNAWNYGLLSPDSVNNTLVGNVYFEPGARSNWHIHPAGQILIITDGVGYHQIEGQAIDTIQKGDVVWCPPNIKHWHGASSSIGLQQIYVVPNTEEGIVNWMDKVSDEEYNGINAL